jgi:hypothetical protein
VAFATRVFRCAEKQHRRSEGSFTNAVVLFNCTFPLYPERVGVPLSDSSGTPRVGGLHALWQDTPESLHPGSSAGSVEVEIQGSQTNAREANRDTPNAVEHVTTMVRTGRQMKQVGLPEVFQEAERRELDKAWARFFYEANIPFVVSKNKAFKETVKRTAEFRRGIYVPPSYHDLRRKFLVQAKESCKHTCRLKGSKAFVSLEQPWLSTDGAQLLIVPSSMQC